MTKTAHVKQSASRRAKSNHRCTPQAQGPLDDPTAIGPVPGSEHLYAALPGSVRRPREEYRARDSIGFNLPAKQAKSTHFEDCLPACLRKPAGLLSQAALWRCLLFASASNVSEKALPHSAKGKRSQKQFF